MATKTATRKRTPRTSRTDIFVAIEDGVVHVDDVGDLIIRKGITRVHRGHPLYKRAPNLFKPIDVHYSVEATTAIPGEQRGA